MKKAIILIILVLSVAVIAIAPACTGNKETAVATTKYIGRYTIPRDPDMLDSIIAGNPQKIIIVQLAYLDHTANDIILGYVNMNEVQYHDGITPMWVVEVYNE